MANVLTVQDTTDAPVVNYLNTRWCVDSGANRDICRDQSMADGDPVPRKLTIGEAGTGHSFCSEAVGPISFKVRGERLPLLSRTIFAKQIHENILSVPEAVDRGYAVLFTKQGVSFYEVEHGESSFKNEFIGVNFTK